MRVVMRTSIACIAASLLAAACEPPPAPVSVGTPVVDPPQAEAPMPSAVTATVEQLRELAEEGTLSDADLVRSETSDDWTTFAAVRSGRSRPS